MAQEHVCGCKLQMIENRRYFSVEDLKTGGVGPPLTCNDILLRDWQEGGYSTSNRPLPQGEILISGANVARGYYKQPQKTAEDFVELDGRRWFCTGDIGELTPDGSLRIIGQFFLGWFWAEIGWIE